MGEVKKPITAYVRKPGVDYGDDWRVGDAAASTAIAAPGADRSPAPEASGGGCVRAGRPRSRRGSPRPRPTTRRRPPSCARQRQRTARPIWSHAGSRRAARIAGHARLRIVNDGAAPSSTVPLMLYPNALATALARARRRSLSLAVPGRVLARRHRAANLRMDGVPAPVTIEDLPLVARHDRQRAARQAARARRGGHRRRRLRHPDPAPLRRVRLRRRSAAADGRLLSRAGAPGAAPCLRALRAASWPRAGRTRVSLKLPPRLALVVDGQPIVNDGAAAPFVVEARRRPVPDHRHRRRAAPGHADRRRSRRALPAPAAAAAGERRPADALRARGHRGPGAAPDGGAQQCACSRTAAGLPPRRCRITLVEAPLRHELVQPHGDVILVSDQIFRIFPLRSAAQVPPHGDRARGASRRSSTRRLARHRGAGRSRSRGGRPGGLPDGASTRAPSSARSNTPRAPAPVRLRAGGRPADLCAAARFFVELLRRRQDDATVRDGVCRLRRRSAPSPRLALQQAARSARAGALSAAGAQAERGRAARGAPRPSVRRRPRLVLAAVAGPLPRVNYRLAAGARRRRGRGGPRRRSRCAAKARAIREPVEVRSTTARAAAGPALGRRAPARTLRRRSAGRPQVGRDRSARPAGRDGAGLAAGGRTIRATDNRDPPRWRCLYEGVRRAVQHLAD